MTNHLKVRVYPGRNGQTSFHTGRPGVYIDNITDRQADALAATVAAQALRPKRREALIHNGKAYRK